jgi:hypothetical protein
LIFPFPQIRITTIALLMWLVSCSDPALGAAGGPAVSLFLPLLENSCSVPIPNGDFEQGRTLWIESSLHPPDQFPLVVTRDYINAFSPGLGPRGGNWAAWLCGIDAEVSSISQQLTVPAACPILSYWHWIDSAAPCGTHSARVVVTLDGNSLALDAFDLCSEKNTRGWAHRQVDLRPYAGRSVKMEIEADCRFADYSSLFLDDLAFQAGTLP